MGFNSGLKGLIASGFTLERGCSSVVSRGLTGYEPARPRLTTLLPPRSTAKPEAVNAVVSS
jgi:hypothetical protein